MSNYAQRSYQLPPTAPWMKYLVGGLFALYVTELVLLNVGLPLERLFLYSADSPAFAPWQVVTRFLVQGRDLVIWVLIGLAFLYMSLPSLSQVLPRNKWLEALGFTAVVATLVPLLLNLAGLFPGPRTGWLFLFMPAFVTFGLASPTSLIHLMGVFPIPGKWIVWGSLILSVLMLLAFPGAASLEVVASWAAIYGWWHWRGPGGRKRQLRAKARKIEEELQRFTVLEGGRQDGPDANNRDDWIH